MTAKVLFTGETHTTNGRNGAVRSSNDFLDIKLPQPHPAAGNLFGAAWSACSMGAIAGEVPQTQGTEKEQSMGSSEMNTMRVIAMALLILGSVSVPDVARAQQAGIKRTDLQRHDLSVPGREAVQVRVDIDPGAAFGRHTHPGEEIIYVLEGSLEYQIEGKAPMTLKAGDVLFIPAGTIHAAKNVGSVTASELATYIVEKGKPLLTLVK
jgi:quercetin dioxygenase-like cupin family protein